MHGEGSEIKPANLAGLESELSVVVESHWSWWRRRWYVLAVGNFLPVRRFRSSLGRKESRLGLDSHTHRDKAGIADRTRGKSRVRVLVEVQRVKIRRLKTQRRRVEIKPTEDLIAVGLIAVVEVGLIVLRACRDDDGRGECIDPPRLLLPPQLYRIEGPADVIPIEGADQPLIALAEDLPAGSQCQREHRRIANLNVGLAQIERVIAFRAKLPGNVGSIREPLTRILLLPVNLQPRRRPQHHTNAQTQQKPVIVRERIDAVIEVEVVLADLPTRAAVKIEDQLSIEKGEQVGRRRFRHRLWLGRSGESGCNHADKER